MKFSWNMLIASTIHKENEVNVATWTIFQQMSKEIAKGLTPWYQLSGLPIIGSTK